MYFLFYYLVVTTTICFFQMARNAITIDIRLCMSITVEAMPQVKLRLAVQVVTAKTQGLWSCCARSRAGCRTWRSVLQRPREAEMSEQGYLHVSIKTVAKTSMKWMKNTGVLLHDLPENELQMGFAMQIDPFPHGQLASIQYWCIQNLYLVKK